MSIYTRGNSSHQALVLFFCWNFTLIVARYYRHVKVLLFIFFQYGDKTKATNFTKNRSETSLLHTLSHLGLKSFDLISLFYQYSQLRFYYARRKKVVKNVGICKWRWRYFWTRNNFFWCFLILLWSMVCKKR